MAILTKGQTFANADTVTSTKLNALVDSAAFVTGARGTTDDTSLEVNGSGRLQVKDLGISSAKIAASAVTTAKLPDSTLATDGVTYAKLQRVASMRVIGNTTGALAAASEVSVLDEDTMSSNSATALATQQSIKAYVDNEITDLFTFATAQASTSGSSVSFTSIPTTVKRITVNLVGVSTNGTGSLRIRLGDSGGFEATTYVSSVSIDSAKLGATDAFYITVSNAATNVYSGSITLVRLSAATNTWIQTGIIGADVLETVHSSAGYKTLSANLDRLQVFTADTFDAGTINITYE